MRGRLSGVVLAWIVVVAIAAAIAYAVARARQPSGSAHMEACRQGYAAALSASDTTVVDARPVRLPSSRGTLTCGDLRASGVL